MSQSSTAVASDRVEVVGLTAQGELSDPSGLSRPIRSLRSA